MEYKKIGEICLVKGGKRLPKGETLVDFKTAHPYIRITDYSTGRLNQENIKYLTDETFNRVSRYTISKDNIFLSIVGTIGIVDIIKSEMDGASLTENAVKIEIKDKSSLDPKYLLYYLKSPQGQWEINIRTVGSTQPKLAITRIKDIPVPIIHMEKQKRIVNILNSLDSKIELNNQMIATLEELAATLFKRWFVDFEFPDENGNPYKSSGGKMVDSELGEIPEGWEITSFSSLGIQSILGDWGKEKQEKKYTKKVNIIRGADIPEINNGRLGKAPVRYILEKNYNPKKIIPNDIIIEISGGSPSQSTGRSAIITEELFNKFLNPILCTNFCRIVRLQDIVFAFYFNDYLTYLYNRSVFFNYENGTTGIKNLDLNAVLETLKIPMCKDKDLVSQYQNLRNSIDVNKISLGIENDKLSVIRDSLLPKLLTGQIRV